LGLTVKGGVSFGTKREADWKSQREVRTAFGGDVGRKEDTKTVFDYTKDYWLSHDTCVPRDKRGKSLERQGCLEKES